MTGPKSSIPIPAHWERAVRPIEKLHRMERATRDTDLLLEAHQLLCNLKSIHLLDTRGPTRLDRLEKKAAARCGRRQWTIISMLSRVE